jgi:hypothetical protein
VRPGVLLIAALALGLAVAACGDDPPQPMGTAPTHEPSTNAGAALGHRRDSSAAASSASVRGEATSGASAAAAVPAPERQDAAASSKAAKVAAPAVVACGDKPAPPCPLAAWMKANASPAITSQNFDALAELLAKTAAFAPQGYTNWASISRDGADAARVQSLDAVKASCRSCHNQYRAKYKAEMRARPLPL